MTENKAKFNLDYTFNLALQRLKQRDHQQVCECTGAFYNQAQQSYSLSYLHTTVTVDQDGEISCDKKQLTLQEKILILHYLLSEKTSIINDENKQLISFKELPGGEIYIAPFTSRAIKPFLSVFADKPDRLAEVASAWGGKVENYGDISISLLVFPLVEIYYVLWQGDEEFPANATVLFRSDIAEFFSTEDVAVLVSQLVYQMPGIVK